MSLFVYVAPLVVAALMCGLFIAFALPQRSVPGLRWFVFFMGTLVFWTLAYAAELLTPGLSGKVLAAKVQYVGISAVGVTWLGFTTEYTGLSRWSRRNLALACLIPVATLVLVWTNEAHGLVWSSVALSTGRPYTVLALGHGPWFWVQVAYSYVCLLLALGLLARLMLVRPPMFRGQAAILLLASLPPWVGNGLYVSGLVDTDLDLTVFGFTISGFLAGWAVLRWKFLSIGPIARDTIVEGMTEAVAVIDLEERVVDVNPAALRILGTDADRVIGWDARAALGRFAPDFSAGPGHRRTVVGPEGGRSYDGQLNPLLDGAGTHRGWTLVLHDVTEREAEAEALSRARVAAEEMALAQRAFLANMNHEFRTPLNGVMGMLQLLLHSDLDPEQKGFADIAYASSQELLDLVETIMDFSAMEMGRIELGAAPFDVAGVVRGVLEGQQHAATAKGIGLRLAMGPDIPAHLSGDGARLGQVLTILVGNAIKFTDQGGVQVTVRASRDLEAIRVVFEVKDTGIGIPAHRIESVFQGFVQVDASSTRRHDGAGLGLALAHRLVGHMGGELTLASEEGRGSTFRFEVPFPAPAAPASPPSV
jgi:signal transduction histidine kinase